MWRYGPETDMDIPETFHKFELDGEILVTPGMAVGNRCWQRKAHRWLRSMHLRADDLSIISCGFPKFMNMGEGVGDYKVTREAILSRVGKDDSLCATLKIDGSMLVRFVQDGAVRFRTRGWLGIRDGSAEIDEFCADNPTLLDPSFAPDDSLLFEWTSPERQIVLRYDRPGLTLIGGVRHERGIRWDKANILLYTPNEVQTCATAGGFPCMEFTPIRSRDDFENLLLSLCNNPDIEGYVIRIDGGQRMAKVKTQNYLTLHALKEGVTSARLAKLWTEWGDRRSRSTRRCSSGTSTGSAGRRPCRASAPCSAACGRPRPRWRTSRGSSPNGGGEPWRLRPGRRRGSSKSTTCP